MMRNPPASAMMVDMQYTTGFRTLLGVLLTGLLVMGCQRPTPRLDLQVLETEIHRLTNVYRESQSLPPLKARAELQRVARAHSEDMVQRQYFEHNSPEGESPDQRLSRGFSEAVILYSGENLAQHSQDDLDASQLAETLLQLWKASPDHQPQLVEPAFDALGVGAAQDEKGVVYATQTFAGLLANLTHPLPEHISTQTPLNLRFEFLGSFEPTELSAFLHTSNGFARIEGPGGVFYQGKGPVPIVWEDDTHFSVRIPTELGAGQYRLRLGQGNRFVAKDYTLQVR